jgi:hypothetical protein
MGFFRDFGKVLTDIGKGIGKAWDGITSGIGNALSSIFAPKVDLPPIVMPEPIRQLAPDLPTLKRPTTGRKERGDISTFRGNQAPVVRLNDLLGLAVPPVSPGIGIPGGQQGRQ